MVLDVANVYRPSECAHKWLKDHVLINQFSYPGKLRSALRGTVAYAAHLMAQAHQICPRLVIFPLFVALPLPLNNSRRIMPAGGKSGVMVGQVANMVLITASPLRP